MDEENPNPVECKKCVLCINGMTCASFVAEIEQQAKKVDGVVHIAGSLMAAEAKVKHDIRILPCDIAKAITDFGYDARVIDDLQ
ncbi:unnamed protein product, partial [Allacma fusca]